MSLYNDASLIMYPSGYKSGKIYCQKPTDGTGDLTFTRASDATRVNSDGEIEVVGSGVPRLDYSQGSCPALLLEPQRTNLVFRSEEFDVSPWTNFGTRILFESVNELNPSGNIGVLRATRITNEASDIFQLLNHPPGFYTVSYFVKNIDSTSITIGIFNGSINGATFNFQTETITIGTITNGNSASAGFEKLNNGWYRLFFSFNSLVSIQRAIFNDPGPIDRQYFIWGAQLEAGSYPTSYIKTTNATATRLADSCSKTGISSLIGQTQGTLFIHATKTTAEPSEMFLGIGDGSTNNRILIITGTDGFIRGYIADSSAIQLNFTSSVSAVGTHKIALAYATNDVVMYIDGVQVVVDNSATIPAVANFYVGTDETTLPQRLNGGLHQAILFKTRLSNIELAELTTL